MAMRLSTRGLAVLRTQSRCLPNFRASAFHTSRAAFLVLGEKFLPERHPLTNRLPPSTLMEKNPSDRIDLSKEVGHAKSIIM
jgi:hypothetical protein